MLSVVKMLLKREVGDRALNNHRITLLIMGNHGNVFLNCCGNPAIISCFKIAYRLWIYFEMSPIPMCVYMTNLDVCYAKK